MDVSIVNPSAPSHRVHRIDAHEVKNAANDFQDRRKTTHYRALSFPDITQMTPQCYYTFNVEATGRIGPAAIKFITDLYRASDKAHELDTVFGPSPIMILTRDLVTVITKFNAQAALFHKRNATLVR